MLPPLCGGACVYSTLGSCARRVGCAFGTAVLKMAANFCSAAVYFSPGYGTGILGAGFWISYVRSADVCVTASARDGIGS